MVPRDDIDTPQLERRHLTVLECDLVGSTALAHKLDPEELRELILAYQDIVLSWVKKLDGYFVQFAGDAIWAYFGYPHAHEDDAYRAIRAGLGMAKTVGSINLYGESLSVRVGIASGLCVVGNMRQAASEDTMDNQVTAIGNPPNLAARLQTLVKPGAVAIADETRSLAGDLFRFEDLGFHDLKGFSGEVKAWRVVGESGERSRFRALRPATQSPLIGRTNEMARIKGLWEEACKNKGQAVYLSGDPGIGKSRLAVSVAEDIVGLDHRQWWLHCGEQMQGSAFAPIIALLQTELSFIGADNNYKCFGKLAQRYPMLDNDALYLLAELLSIEEGDKLAAPQMSPSRRREYLYEILLGLVETECQSEPLLLVVEDMHWIDPSTQELLQRLTLRSTNFPLLLLITRRTAYTRDKPVMGLFHVHEINIEQLQRDDCFILLNTLWDKGEIPRAIAEQIVNKTDGVPLFIEDVMFDLRHSTEHALKAVMNESITVPAKLSEHLMSRIDKFGESKHIAQIGAVVGREFSFSMMETLTQLPAATLRDKLTTLINAGLLLTSASGDEQRYVFKHAMIREVAYDSLLIADRKALHQRIADWFEAERPIIRQSQPETLAYHYKQADTFDLAIHYWLEAGRRAINRSHYVEAIIHLKHAHQLIPRLAASPHRDRCELDIITALGVAHAGAGGISGEDTGKVYDKAWQLCQALDYPVETFPILSGACSFHFLRSNYEKAHKMAVQAMQLATEKSNPTGKVIGHRILGAVQCVRGEFDASIKSSQTAIRLYDEDPAFHRGYALAYAMDHKTSALCYLALANVAIGMITTSLKISQQSVTHSENIDLHSMNLALCYQAAIRHLQGDTADRIHDVATRSLELALEEGYATWIGISRLVIGEAAIRLGHTEEGMREIEQGVSEHSNVMAQTFLPFAQSVLAKGYLATRQADKAQAVLAKAEALSLKSGQLWYLPEIQRIHAEALLQLEQYGAAHDNYQKAWTTANKIGAKFWQLKIACSMADNETLAKQYKETCVLFANAAKTLIEDNKEMRTDEIQNLLNKLYLDSQI
jgi:predicted ATPase/class 3 adenylate cyclase